MSDIPTVEQRAADVIAEFMCGATRVRPVGASLQLAAALAAAGLLADPTTSRTDDERAVIEAAIAWVARIVSPPGMWADAHDLALIAAVDRLAAPGPKEAT